MAASRYRRNAGSVFSLKYHLVWCPKYRRSVLVGPVEERLKALLREKATALRAEPTEAVQHLVNQFKGYTSRSLRQEFPVLRSRLPSPWSRPYYAGTVGHVSESTVRRSIEAQKGQ